MDLPLDCRSGSGEDLVDLPRCARRGFRCAPRLRRAPQSGDAHSKRATGATCPYGTNGVPIRAVASRPLWIPRRESPCDSALRAGTLSGAAFGGKNRERVPPRGGFGFSALRTDGLFRAPPGRSRCAACGGGDCRVPPRQAGRLLARPRSRRKKGAQGDFHLGRPARAAPGARYARRPLAGAPPRDPGLSPLRGPGPAGRNFKRYPPGVPCHNPQTTAAPHGYTSCGHNSGCGRSQQRTPEGSPRSATENNARSGRSRALRACAAKPRSFPPPCGRCAPRKSGRASPKRTPGTVPETLRQRHCARGAAAGGML